MFGMSGTELIIILVLALLLLGPEKLPEMAKLAGKTMREFQKATDDVRSTVEREFHRLEQEADVNAPPKPPPAAVVEFKPPLGSVPSSALTTVAETKPGLPSPSTSDMDLSARVISIERKPEKGEGPA
jgi:sec-independent protein translocase protein TatB